MKLVKLSLTSMLAVTMLFSSCQSTRQTTSGTGDTSTTTGNRTETSTTGTEKPGMSKTTKGGIIGAGSGAVIGGVIGNRM
ncbi:MAG: hypothetical protein LPK07_07205, partial [Hymenobacteraceae bacterium]|nr:hypothetical protein [Hymenobacteraceae bacterium]